ENNKVMSEKALSIIPTQEERMSLKDIAPEEFLEICEKNGQFRVSCMRSEGSLKRLRGKCSESTVQWQIPLVQLLKRSERWKVLMEEFRLYNAYLEEVLSKIHKCMQFFRIREEFVAEFHARRNVNNSIIRQEFEDIFVVSKDTAESMDYWQEYDVEVVHQVISQLLASYTYDLLLKVNLKVEIILSSVTIDAIPTSHTCMSPIYRDATMDLLYRGRILKDEQSKEQLREEWCIDKFDWEISKTIEISHPNDLPVGYDYYGYPKEIPVE
ncbi:12023_t:CDS:2, partial [Funneliformis mosseae]